MSQMRQCGEAMDENSLENAAEVLIKNNLFSCLPYEAVLSGLSGDFEVKSFLKGETVCNEKFFERAIGVIISGSVSVKKGHMQMSYLKKGSIFGAVTLYTERENFVTEITSEENSTIVFLHKSTVSKLISEYPIFAERFISYLSERIFFLNERIDALTGRKSEDKLLTFLKNSADFENGQYIYTVNNYGLLAGSLDIGRASLYRAMDSLERDGKICRDDKKIIIKE